MHKYTPLNEGVDHINMYSGSALPVGKALSNFATGNIHTRHGRFMSMEGYWYWLSTGMRHEVLRHLSGLAAKKEGKSHEKVFVDDFELYIKEALTCKILTWSSIVGGLRRYPDLPIVHYYYYGEPDNCKIVELPEQQWMVDWINQLATVVRQLEPIKLLIAGSRDLQRKDTITAFLKLMIRSDMYPDLILINGLARGVDRDAYEIAKSMGISVSEYPADWDKYGKGAGRKRNREMGDVSDVAMTIWDGTSAGTEHMIEYMHQLNKPVMIVK